MKKHPNTHRAPYYGGDNLKKTLDEAEAAFRGRAIPTRRSWLRKYAPEIVIVISAIAVVISAAVSK
jgi:hypothetical protein